MPKNHYLRKVLRASVREYSVTVRITQKKLNKTGNAMCKRSTVGTYLTVNALHDNAQPCVFLKTIIVGQFL